MKLKNVEDIYPLSPMQQGMLFHSLYAPDSGQYFQQVSCTLEGELHIPTFELAWQHVAQRYPALRTAFFGKDFKSRYKWFDNNSRLISATMIGVSSWVQTGKRNSNGFCKPIYRVDFILPRHLSCVSILSGIRNNPTV